MTTAEPIVRLAGVTKRFGRVVAVDDVTVDVPRRPLPRVARPERFGQDHAHPLHARARAVAAGSIRVRGREVPHDVRRALSGVGAIVEEPRFSS